MKITLIFLLAILTIIAVGCSQSPTEPGPAVDDQLYRANLVGVTTANWFVEVEYPGQAESYNGRYTVGFDDRDVNWRSQYGMKEADGKTLIDTRITVHAATAEVVRVFTVNYDKAISDDRSWIGPGWVKDGDTWYVQLDCR